MEIGSWLSRATMDSLRERALASGRLDLNPAESEAKQIERRDMDLGLRDLLHFELDTMRDPHGNHELGNRARNAISAVQRSAYFEQKSIEERAQELYRDPRPGFTFPNARATPRSMPRWVAAAVRRLKPAANDYYEPAIANYEQYPGHAFAQSVEISGRKLIMVYGVQSGRASSSGSAYAHNQTFYRSSPREIFEFYARDGRLVERVEPGR